MSKLVDLTGNRYGMLTVIGFDHVDSTNGAMWKVRCDCGIETIKRGRSIKAGASLTCGNHKWNKLENGVAARNALYRVYKAGAKKRNYSFDLSLDIFTALTQKSCFYCGAPPLQKTVFRNSYNGQYTYNGIDRIDNTKGYIEGNVVACCGICNMMKGSMNHLDFVNHIARISDYLGMTIAYNKEKYMHETFG